VRDQGFQKPGGLARITYDPHGEHGSTVKCSCGWRYRHKREKVREDAIDRHINKKHQGRGIRI
jgi:hypothetical protein